MNLMIMAAAAFNLACTGTQSTDSILGKKSKPYETLYRLNLEKNEWCEGECKSIHKIEAVQPSEIVLEDTKVDSVSQRSIMRNSINRETGAHSLTSSYSNPRIRGSGIMMSYTGVCEKRDFSGFPALETKF